MPDISMCKGDLCYIRTICYRFTANPSIPMQSYMVGKYLPHTESCEYFMVDDRDKGSKV